MRIGGLQKTTLLDFPGRVSAIVFTRGCNFRCPYCHNPELVFCDAGTGQNSSLNAAVRQKTLLEPTPESVLDFLAERARLLQGVVITGGEPALQKDLDSFCSILKGLGYAIKLDTNGSRPEALHKLLSLDLLDYVAMDIKAVPGKYPEEISPDDAGAAIIESIALLEGGSVPHEFRIPCLAPFVNKESFEEILEATRGAAPLFLQMIRLNHVLRPDFFEENGQPLTREEMEFLKKQAENRGRDCFIR